MDECAVLAHYLDGDNIPLCRAEISGFTVDAMCPVCRILIGEDPFGGNRRITEERLAAFNDGIAGIMQGDYPIYRHEGAVYEKNRIAMTAKMLLGE